ncbi:hypothetical protein CYY_002902 [Polysphondylium violaceum]|uniref:Uncharacterized protein n=1 Tax=Polysphondylium violaceum TaxID=133409 RepID=A0A8J4PZC9_9MYCE|nr:hypothetical protein CYY_002902 [Polysphondylium violaceum]
MDDNDKVKETTDTCPPSTTDADKNSGCRCKCDDHGDDNNTEEVFITQSIDKQVTPSICKKCGLCKYVPLKIPMYAPYTLKGLDPNEQYYYCTCGLTTGQQPLCDQKSCIGTKFQPKPFVLGKKQTMFLLCGCRYTSNPPYCDAIHTRLPFNPTDPPCKCSKVDEW